MEVPNAVPGGVVIQVKMLITRVLLVFAGGVDLAWGLLIGSTVDPPLCPWLRNSCFYLS